MMANLNQLLDAIFKNDRASGDSSANRLRMAPRKITSISEIVGLEGDSVVM
ncbi:hypothetical protein OH492_26735 [Vibrio chagasii]|nr:hypothetical protein [Vibrio chagasii]